MFKVSPPREYKVDPEGVSGKNMVIYDVLDDNGRVIVSYFLESRALGVVNYLNKMAETSVKE